MGIALAAQALRLDLKNAEVNLDQGRIVLRGPNAPNGLFRWIKRDFTSIGNNPFGAVGSAQHDPPLIKNSLLRFSDRA